MNKKNYEQNKVKKKIRKIVKKEIKFIFIEKFIQTSLMQKY